MQGPPGAPAPGPLPDPPELPQGRFYRGVSEEGQDVDLGTLDKILELHKKMSHLRSPAGTRESPARSCLDISLQDSQTENGVESTYLRIVK